MRIYGFAMVFAILAAMMTTGCGGSSALDTHLVTGNITFDGQPISEGRIQFRALQGDQRAFSSDIKGGKYELQAFAGKASVEVRASRPVPGKYDESNPGEKVPVGEMYIPSRYNTQTELTADVTPGRNQIDFALTSDGGE